MISSFSSLRNGLFDDSALTPGLKPKLAALVWSRSFASSDDACVRGNHYVASAHIDVQTLPGKAVAGVRLDYD